MKKISIIFFLFILSMQVFSQRDTLRLCRVEFGWGFQFNQLNEDRYFSYMSENYSPFAESMQGFTLRFSMNYFENADLFFGAMVHLGTGKYGMFSYNPGSTNSTDYVLNGGGVFMGIRPHTRGKHFGLDAELAAGILAYKEYRVFYDNVSSPVPESVYDKKSSVFGGTAGIGFYLRGKTIGINPEFQVIMAGGNNGSFLFYGFNVPLTIDF